MGKFKSCFIITLMAVLSFFVFGFENVKAEINNFNIESEKIVIENDNVYPFFDVEKDKENVIKSGNSGVDSSESILTIKFTGIGTISFDYFISSEGKWDYISISVDGNQMVDDSGGGSTWQTFSWYSEENKETVIVVKYSKDASISSFDDCCYLKNLSLDESVYTPLLTFSIDGVEMTTSGVIYYDYENNEGVLNISSNSVDYDIDEYVIEVKLNNEIMEGNNHLYDLKNSEYWSLNNNIFISYYFGEYKVREVSLAYNVNLNEVLGTIDYVNDENNLFVLKEYEGEMVVSSSNSGQNSSSALKMEIQGSGIISFKYLMLGVRNNDFFMIVINNSIVVDVNEANNEFQDFSYTLYDNTLNTIVIRYYKNSSNDEVDCFVCLKDVSFQSVSYAPISQIKLNNDYVLEGGKIVVTDSSYNIELEGVASGVTVQLFLNETLVSKNSDEEYIYTLENFRDTNVVEVKYILEGSESRSIKFYLYLKNVNNVFCFENDSEHPLVYDTLENDVVIRTTIEDEAEAVSTITYTAADRGILSVDFFASISEGNYFIVSVNGEVLLEETDKEQWLFTQWLLNAGDVVSISFEKNLSDGSKDEIIYFKNIYFTIRNYTDASGGMLGDKEFNKNTSIIYFDWENKNALLSFTNLKPTQSVEVNINDVPVDAVENIYNLNNYLEYNNVITIKYSEDGCDDIYLTINYVAILVGDENISYDFTPAFALMGYDNETIISLNNSLDKFEEEKLTISVDGKGYFKMAFNYYVGNSLEFYVCFDEAYCSYISNNYDKGIWFDLNYEFTSEGNHSIFIVINGTSSEDVFDYVYIKDVSFVKKSYLVSLIDGEGTNERPYDYLHFVETLKNEKIYYFEYNFYNYDNFLVYVTEIEGFAYKVNGVSVSGSTTLSVSLNEKGSNTFEFSDSEITIILYYINPGLNDSSINEGVGTKDDPFKIASEEQLRDIAKGLEYCYILTSDIHLTSKWIPIGDEENPFTGCFDGNDKNIYGLVLENQYLSGLFGVVLDGEITNLKIENPSITGGACVGSLMCFSQNTKVENVYVINTDISVSNTEDVNIAVGGVVGQVINSNFRDVHVSGNVYANSTSVGAVGGISGVGGNFYDSQSSVNVVGNGFVGGIIGYASNSVVQNSTVSGNISLLNNYLEDSEIGIVSSSSDVSVSNVTHSISGTYFSESLTVVDAFIFGIGLNKDGVEVLLDNGSFSASVILNDNESEFLYGAKAGINGYVIRFNMGNNKFRYYELFDFSNNEIKSKEITINLDTLNEYENNLSSLQVSASSDNYTEVEFEENLKLSLYLNVYVNSVSELEHLRYVINYGLRVSFGEYNVFGIGNLSLNLVINGNLDLSSSNYSGLSNSVVFPYLGSINGQGNTIKMSINKSNSKVSAFINYYASEHDVLIQNIILEGIVSSKDIAGFVGVYLGQEKLTFKNVSNYMIVDGVKAAILLGVLENGTILFYDCSNYADVISSVFIGGQSSGNILYDGNNVNYGSVSNNEGNKNVYEIFFGSSSVVANSENANLEIYYELNVFASGISLKINKEDYTSDENKIISFKMNNDNLYSATISSEFLKEKEYELNSSFKDTMVLPISINLDSGNIYHIDHLGDWVINVNIGFSDSTFSQIELNHGLTEDQINGYELSFNNLTLNHDTYVINQTVNLTRYTSLLNDYKNLYNILELATEEFKDKANETRKKLDELKGIYREDNVTQETLMVYNRYLEDNSLVEENLNDWMKVIIDSISLSDEQLSVVYGDEVEPSVKIQYLDGTVVEQNIPFDYALEDIVNDFVNIKSKETFVSKKGDVVVYDEYIVFEVAFNKKKIIPVVEKYVFDYDGLEKHLNIDVPVSDKFNDAISNVSIKYLSNGEEVINPIDAGEYTVEFSFEVTNSECYDFSDFIVQSLIIEAKKVDVIWEGEFESYYSNENKLDSVSVYYFDIYNNKVEVSLNTGIIVDAGEYDLVAFIEDSNYIANENTTFNTYKINKIDINVSISDYSMNVGGEVPNIVINVEGEACEGDVIHATYQVTREDEIYSIESLIRGVFDLEVVIFNEERISVNYNLNIKNGSITVDGVDTTIIANARIEYDYNGETFNTALIGAKVKDEDGKEITSPVLMYTYLKNNEVVDEIKAAGNYVVRVDYEGDDTYNESQILVTVVIKPISISIEIDNVIGYYGDELKNLTYSVSNGYVLENDDLGIVLTKEEGTDIGKYLISGVCNNISYVVTFINGEYEIKPRNVKIKIEDKESDYFEELVALTYRVEEGTVINGDSLNIVLTKEEGLDAGVYRISGAYDNEKYNVTFIEGVYVINKLDIDNINLEDIVTEYSGNSIDYSVDNTILSDGSEAEVTYFVNNEENVTIVNAGVYNVKAVIENKNYNTLNIEVKITVNQVYNPLGYDEDYEEVEYSSNVNYGLENVIFPDGRSAYVTYVILMDSNIVTNIFDLGEYTVVASIIDKTGNYVNKSSSKTIKVIEKKITVEYSSDTLIYNGLSQYPKITSVETFKMSFNTEDGLAPVKVGNYTIKIEPYNPNYKITNDVFNFRIDPLEVEYSNSKVEEYEYCGSAVDNSVTIKNAVLGDEVFLELEYYLKGNLVNEIKNAGEYVVKIIGLRGQDSNNYALSDDADVQVKILPKTITVRPIEVSKVYSENDPRFGYSLSTPLFNDDQISGALSREEGEDVGTYKINLGTLSAGDNYALEISNKASYLQITPKPINISYESPLFRYDGSEKKLEVNLSGEAHVEYVGDLINVGTYYIKVIVDNNNYCLPENYEDIAVVIEKRDVSNSISLINEEYTYTGSAIVAEVECGMYSCDVRYFSDENEVESIIYPGIYKIKVIIETSTDIGILETNLAIKKIKGSAKEVGFESYYNRIIMDKDDSLEYKIDNGEYYSSNVFSGLREETNYTISVRSKETGVAYASDPITYIISTTKNPKVIHELIDSLTNEVKESNLIILRKIEENLKKVNEKEINEEKFAFYEEVKANFNNIMNSYEENLTTSNKLFDFMEMRVVVTVFIIPLLATLFVIRKKFDIL